jgi:polysaccharide pyruvyl transferase WcaK-like protein
MLRISYAASIGKSFINESLLEDFSRCLKKFDAISVREKSAAALIKSLTEKDVSSVLDPTLLLIREQWAPLCADVDINVPYLLVYSIGDESSPIFKRLVEQVAQRRGLRVITFHKRKHYRNEMRRVPNAGPREFLGLFSKATFVVTNSFHGTAFSIIFKKPFFCVRSDNKNSRQRDLLNALDIGDRLVVDDSTTDAQVGSEINYAHVEEKLQILREHSIAFLKSALEITKATPNLSETSRI